MIQHEIEMDPEIPLRVSLLNSTGINCMLGKIRRDSGSLFCTKLLHCQCNSIARMSKLRRELKERVKKKNCRPGNKRKESF